MTLRGLLARALAAVIAVILLYLAAVLVLGLAYRFITPVSTLMLGRWATFQGAARTAVSLDQVAPAVPLAVVTSEDARFCMHRGVDWDALREVVEDEEGPSRGASTVPMQVAKNLFLWPGRSYLRKALELPIALYLDLVWPKRRMMENYLNIAEWGPGVFGIEAAARHHFRKAARDLSRQEAALLVAALPNPKLRNPGRPSPRHRNLANRLLVRMNAAAPFAGCIRR
ncbi:MAG: mtgA [Microvirga sp.]|jgi:monofunctional biosynthetic peptidoglycan transglycosylase|nr:mtgA [Microvirga sp.]